MCTTEEQNKVSAEEVANNQPVANQLEPEQVAELPDLEAKEKQKQYYLEESRKWCPWLGPDSSDEHRLRMLRNKMKHFVKALANFDRPWEKGMGEIEKACLACLSTQNLSSTERRELREAFSVWLDFLVNAAFHRSFVTQVLQEHSRQLRDLENFLGWKASETPESLNDTYSC